MGAHAMERWKDLFSKILNKDAFYEQQDVTQNIFAFRVFILCILFYSFDMLLNLLHIFIVDQRIFATGYLVACGITVVYLLLLFGLGLDHWMTKYISITALGLLVLSASTALTYHMIIAVMLPILVASMYASKYVSFYSVFMTVVSITISTYVGYYFGVCDANMVLLTTTSLKNLSRDGHFLLNQVNQNPVMTLGLYYVVPRSLIAIAFFYVSTNVNRVIRKSMERALMMKHEAFMDDMTGLYNKNKLLSAMEECGTRERAVAVVYWDVNRLKYVNDTYGHLCGDQLIRKIADSIHAVAREEACAYRYGGDEFLMIIPDGGEETAKEMISRWRQIMEPIQQGSPFPVSASVGYAVGTYEHIMELIATADQRMYEDKDVHRD